MLYLLYAPCNTDLLGIFDDIEKASLRRKEVAQSSRYHYPLEELYIVQWPLNVVIPLDTFNEETGEWKQHGCYWQFVG